MEVNDLVPLDLLPPDARTRLGPNTPETKAYLRFLEQQRKLPEGSLTRAQLNGVDPLRQAMDLADFHIEQQRKHDELKAKTTAELRAMADPTAGQSRTDRLMAGAGKAVNDTAQGLGQLTGQVPQSLVDETARLDAPLMRDPYGLLGNIGSQALLASTAMGPMRAGALGQIASNPLISAGVSGAGYSALQPVESGSSRSTQAVLGGLANMLGEGVFGQGLPALVRPASAGVSPELRRLANFADRQGIDLRAADVSNNPVLRAAQHALDYMPFSGGHDQREVAQKAFNAAIAKTMGQGTDDLSFALKGARPDLGAKYDSIFGRNVVELNPGVHGTKLTDAWKDFASRDTSIGQSHADSLDTYLNNIFDPANGFIRQNPATGLMEMDGKTFKKIRSEAARTARSLQSSSNNGTGDPQAGRLSDFYDAIKQTLDHASRNSPSWSQADRDLLKQTDKHWGNMKTLENLSPKSGSGDIDFNALASLMMRKGGNNVYNRDAMIYGTGDQTLSDLGKVGTTFLGRDLPPSNLRPWVRSVKDAAPYAIGLPAAGAGLYSLNSHEGGSPIMDTIAELGALGLMSKGLGSAANSKWFSRGAPSFVQGAVGDQLAPLTARLPMSALDATERRGVPGMSFEDGAR
jgi:hypothetical protein